MSVATLPPRRLEDHETDVVVIGGGIAGAGVARDLALRGFRATLIEKADFAYGTTSRSSKLIHGGLRYLELFDFGLVRESLRERETLRRLAPHVVKPLPFLVPIYRASSRGLIKVRIGLKLYDLLTPGRDRERSRVLRPIDALSLEPAIRAEGLRGAGYYFDDLLLLPERFCLENVLSACRHGARAVNYAEVDGFVRDPGGTLAGVRVHDLVTDKLVTITARAIVNATGPWVDELRARAGVAERGKRIVRTTKGIHCLLPRLSERAIYHSTSDDRMIFVIPWREFSLVGTTDTDFDGDLDRVHATGDEVAYLLGEVRKAVTDRRVTESEVAYTYAGVRPLTFEEGKRASNVSRAHKVIAEEDGRFLSITGTKLTCYRSLAEDVGNRIATRLGRRRGGRTARLTLDGLDEDVTTVEARATIDVSAEVTASGLAPETIEALVATYGRGFRRVAELAGKLPDGRERLCPRNPEIAAQVHVAVHEELAVSLQDVLLRRTGLGTSRCQGLDCAEAIGRRMAALAGWTPRRLAAELDAYRKEVARSHRFRAP
ncbi:MAG: glycerol-3-phosphate dehydrogenase/oxidase [Candidatus Rokubacteria bacterium]|nr:glycerol-3-phosphate dehydrogenase/oxidase [Candidatus Rokubacteria bacterium]